MDVSATGDKSFVVHKSKFLVSVLKTLYFRTVIWVSQHFDLLCGLEFQYIQLKFQFLT